MSKRVFVNGDFPHIIAALGRFRAEIMAVKPNPHLPKPIAAHADMNFFVLDDELFIAGDAKAENPELSRYKIRMLGLPGDKYPYDVICNAKTVGKHLFCNVRTIDSRIMESAESKNYSVVNVRQGYTGCSISKVTDNAIITSDKGIADAAEKHKIDVLYIDNNEIKLPGYDIGFIGGCTGSLSDTELLFTGNLDKCSFGKAMRDFCSGYGVTIYELTDDCPLDIGGFIVI